MAEVTVNVPEPKRHDEPMIDAFLKDGGYASIEEWMLDSDYYKGDYGWCTDEGHHVEPEDAIEGAMESCGFIEEYMEAHG